MKTLKTALQFTMERLNKTIMPFLWIYLTTGLAGVIAASEIERRFNVTSWLQRVSLLVLLAALCMAAIGILAMIPFRSLRKDLWTTTQLLFLVAGFSVAVLIGSTHSTTALALQSAQQIQIGDGFIAVNGATAPRLARDLEGLIHPSLKIERIHLSNPGGSVQAAIAAARLLRGRGVNTAVIEGDCASACAIMALHFPARYLAAGASLGLHDIHSPSGNAEAVATERAALMASFSAEGLNVDVLDNLMKTRRMIYPSRSDLLRDGLVTGCWDMKVQQPTPCG